MKNQIAFLTTIFPIPEDYLIQFFESLEKQTIKNFDVLVVNDGYKNFSSLRLKFDKLNIIEIESSDSPAKNREVGINFAIEQAYKTLIFGDSDDYFSKNRVEVSLKLLSKYDLVVNDLTLFNYSGVYKSKYISNRLPNGYEVSLDFVKEKNVFGFTNTAVNLNKVSKVSFNPDIVAVDWYFFTTLLLKGTTAVFTNQCISYYRQHEDSLIGLKVLSLPALKTGLLAKLNHYKNFPEFECLHRKIQYLLGLDRELLFMKLKEQDVLEYPLWWEEVKG